jgi:hypothetical protein
LLEFKRDEISIRGDFDKNEPAILKINISGGLYENRI